MLTHEFWCVYSYIHMCSRSAIYACKPVCTCIFKPVCTCIFFFKNRSIHLHSLRQNIHIYAHTNSNNYKSSTCTDANHPHSDLYVHAYMGHIGPGQIHKVRKALSLSLSLSLSVCVCVCVYVCVCVCVCNNVLPLFRFRIPFRFGPRCTPSSLIPSLSPLFPSSFHRSILLPL